MSEQSTSKRTQARNKQSGPWYRALVFGQTLFSWPYLLKGFLPLAIKNAAVRLNGAGFEGTKFAAHTAGNETTFSATQQGKEIFGCTVSPSKLGKSVCEVKWGNDNPNSELTLCILPNIRFGLEGVLNKGYSPGISGVLLTAFSRAKKDALKGCLSELGRDFLAACLRKIPGRQLSSGQGSFLSQHISFPPS